MKLPELPIVDVEHTENEKNRLTEGEKIPYSGFTSGFALDRPIQRVCTGGAKRGLSTLFCISDIGHAAWRPSQGNFYLAQKWSESYPQIVALAVVKADEPQAYLEPSCARFA